MYGLLRNRKIYTYPDGTTSFNRPKDGHIFHIFDSAQTIKATWQWDDIKEQWFNVSSGKPTPQNTATFTINSPHSVEYIPISITIDTPSVKCECGSDAVGSPKHSSWCNKYDASV